MNVLLNVPNRPSTSALSMQSHRFNVAPNHICPRSNQIRAKSKLSRRASDAGRCNQLSSPTGFARSGIDPQFRKPKIFSEVGRGSTCSHLVANRWVQANSTSDGSNIAGSDVKLQPGDLIQASDSTGDIIFAEVTSSSSPQDAALKISWKGSVWNALPARDGSWRATAAGPTLSGLAQQQLLSAFPGWRPPAVSIPSSALELTSVQRVGSLTQLEADVKANPSLWRDGTGEGDPPLSPLQHSLLNAGELIALTAGLRGLVMVQLSVGWDSSAPQPVFSPYVLPLLLRATAADSGIRVIMSTASGGLGVSAILCADKEPWASWGAHLASFGAQAAIVAESPYYKLLIGRILGYKEANIIHHIRATNGAAHPTLDVISAVNVDLMKLSGKKPTLPWNKQQPSRKKKKDKVVQR